MPLVVPGWLAEHVDLAPSSVVEPVETTHSTFDIEDLAATLVSVGIEEEAIHGAAVTGPLVVGRVLAMTPEPQKNGKTINWCLVDVGPAHNTRTIKGVTEADLVAAGAPETGARGIVCGAHNFAPGDLVVVALPDTVLPGPFPIAARKTYGHVSDGMICSTAELGLPGDSDGIIVLPRDFGFADAALQPGQDAIALLGLGTEVLEINITPDRGYQLSYRGVAREYSLATGASFTDPGLLTNPAGTEPGLATTHASAPAPTADGFPVEIADAAPIHGQVGCDRFVTRIVRGVNPTAPTPSWLAQRLADSGMRSISLIVDITNYVMLDLGQPIHAYDLDKVAAPIVVRRAAASEHLTTLDGVNRILNPEDLLITDSPEGQRGARVLGLAGVMGGASSEISDTTTNVLVEAAHFDPVSVARTARRHKLPSEAAKRFERGVDPALPPVAAQRVVDLLIAYAGGTDYLAVSDYDVTTPPASIDLPVTLPTRIVGVPYDQAQITDILTKIGCQVEPVSVIAGLTRNPAINGTQPELAIAASTEPVIAGLTRNPANNGAQSEPVIAASTAPIIAASTAPVIAASTETVIAGSTRNPAIHGAQSEPVIAHSPTPVIAGLTRNPANNATQPTPTLRVTPPTWRPDLTEPIDLVEEIVRIAGYDQIPSILPAAPGSSGQPAAHRATKSVARTLAEQGLVETLSYPFVAPDNPFTARGAIRLANPLQDDRPLMRTSLLATLCETAQRNVSRGLTDFGIFEQGMVTTPRTSDAVPAPVPPGAHRPDASILAQLQAAVPDQPVHVAGILVGDLDQTGWWGKGRAASWRDALALAELVAERVGIKVRFTKLISDNSAGGVGDAPNTVWHPGRSAAVTIAGTSNPGAEVGIAGELHPKLCKAFGLPARTVAFELDLTALVQQADAQPTQATPVSPYPAAKEDFAFVVADDVPAEAVAHAIKTAAGPLLEDLALFDVFAGEQLGAGKKSLAFSVRLRAADHTLEPQEVRTVRDAIIESAAQMGADLRG